MLIVLPFRYPTRPPDPNDPLQRYRPHWLQTVSDRMKGSAMHIEEDITVRIKRIDHYGRTAYLFKNSFNRVRIILMSVNNTIVTMTSMPPDPNPASPHTPLYPQENEEACLHRVFPMQDDLVELSKHCAYHMTRETAYSNKNYPRIPIADDPRFGFEYGEIQHAERISKNGQSYWRFTVSGAEDRVVEVDILTSAIRYDFIKPEYVLIWKDETLAEVAAWSDISAFYQEYDAQGVPYPPFDKPGARRAAHQ